MEMEKKSCNKNVSEDDAGSKEDKSDAAEEELKDDDKLYFVSASEDLNTNIATTNKNKSTYDNTRTIDNNSSSKSTEHTLINTVHHHDTSTSIFRNAVSSKHITPILSTNYLLTKEIVSSLSLFTLSLFLHETDKCLINQPNANYHMLVINNLKKKSFQTAMTIDTNDITEETCNLFYKRNYI